MDQLSDHKDKGQVKGCCLHWTGTVDHLNDHKDKGQVKGYVVAIGLEPWTN